MKRTTFFLALLLIPCIVSAAGVGVVPDRLVFEGEEERFRVVNPNNEAMEFAVSSETISCVPESGEIEPDSYAEIVCTADEDSPSNATILVETAMHDDGSVSMMPAVAIKAQINRKNKESFKENSSTGKPLTISGAQNSQKQENTSAFSEMKAEIVTICVLVTAIIAVLAYSELKKKGETIKKSEKMPDNHDNHVISSAESSKAPPQEPGQSTHLAIGHHAGV